MTLQKNSYTSCCMLALCMLVPANLTATTAQKIQNLSEETVRVERAVQLTHEAWVEEKDSLLEEIARLKKKQEQVDWQRKKIKIYRTGLEKKIIELTQKSEAMEAIKMELLPILEKNLARLQQTVASDLPYNIDERKRSLRHADLVVNDYDAGLLEKTRSVLDAMAREVDLGHTVGVLEAGIEVDNEQRRVKVLQLGRIGLFSVTMDGHTAYRWDPADSSWKDTSGSVEDIQAAIETAQGLRLVGLSCLPIKSIATADH